jgi:hypothetical protein
MYVLAGIMPRLFVQDYFFFKTLLISSIISLQSVMALTASSLFKIPPPPLPGNCEGYGIDTAVTEAFDLATNAVNAIQTLLQDNVPRTAQNEILARTAYALWGAETESGSPSTFMIASDGKSTLQQAASKLSILGNCLS